MKILDREETFEYLKDKVYNNERIVVPRYGDGEYLLMTSGRNVAKETSKIVGPLLKKSVKVKGQFVCTVKRLTGGGVWANTCKYIMKEGGHALYGAGAWVRWDFKRNNEVLPFLFSGRVLIVAGFGKEAEELFKDIQPNVKSYTIPKKQASNNYKTASKDITNICTNFDNILFACGPIGKVILSDIVNKTEANLVDIGSLLPAILSKDNKEMLKTWSMSSYKNHPNLDRLVSNFLEKI